MSYETYTYDVVIMGAGVAGCATAIALKNLKPELRIAIFERNEENSGRDKVYRIGETIPAQTAQQLRRLGIWEAFLKCDFAISYGTAAAWGSSQIHCNEFMFSTNGYGWRLDRKLFDRFMQEETAGRGVEICFGSRVSEIHRKENAWSLIRTTEITSESIRTRFLVDATGKKSALAAQLGISKERVDQLVGIYTHIPSEEVAKSTENTIGKGTFIESDSRGWWYSTTVPDGSLVLAYMTDSDIAKEMLLQKTIPFRAHLEQTETTRKRITPGTTFKQLKLVAAHTQKLEAVSGEGWLAVGDAAMSYDPLSSLGIYKALASSGIASFAIADSLRGEPLGVKKYARFLEAEFRMYEQKKNEYYAQERRFIAAPFWHRRHVGLTNNQSLTA